MGGGGGNLGWIGRSARVCVCSTQCEDRNGRDLGEKKKKKEKKTIGARMMRMGKEEFFRLQPRSGKGFMASGCCV